MKKNLIVMLMLVAAISTDCAQAAALRLLAQPVARFMTARSASSVSASLAIKPMVPNSSAAKQAAENCEFYADLTQKMRTDGEAIVVKLAKQRKADAIATELVKKSKADAEAAVRLAKQHRNAQTFEKCIKITEQSRLHSLAVRAKALPLKPTVRENLSNQAAEWFAQLKQKVAASKELLVGAAAGVAGVGAAGAICATQQDDLVEEVSVVAEIVPVQEAEQPEEIEQPMDQATLDAELLREVEGNLDQTRIEDLLKRGANKEVMLPVLNKRLAEELRSEYSHYWSGQYRIEILLKLGADANIMMRSFRYADVGNSEPVSALSYAVEIDDYQSVKKLLEYGANPNLGTNEFSMPLVVAGSDEQLVELLLDHGAKKGAAQAFYAITKDAIYDCDSMSSDYSKKKRLNKLVLLKELAQKTDLEMNEPWTVQARYSAEKIADGIALDMVLREKAAYEKKTGVWFARNYTRSQRNKLAGFDEVIQTMRELGAKTSEELAKEHMAK